MSASTEVNVTVKFADGTARVVSAQLAERVVGLDADGNIVVRDFNFNWPLTPCCNASGKGGQRGVICRACYRDVADYFGGQATIAVTRVV